MRVHFGDRTAEMHHEHSDTPDIVIGEASQAMLTGHEG